MNGALGLAAISCQVALHQAIYASKDCFLWNISDFLYRDEFRVTFHSKTCKKVNLQKLKSNFNSRGRMLVCCLKDTALKKNV